MSYPKIILAICDQLQHRCGIRGEVLFPHCDDVADRVLKCQAVMPDFLRSGMRLLTWAFDYWGLITSGSRFHRMPTELQRNAAVNSWGRVHGYAGLYIADASILCASPGVHPQAVIMALARRNSEHFLKA